MPLVGAVGASVATSVGTLNQNVAWPKATLPGPGSPAGDGARIVPWRQPGVVNKLYSPTLRSPPRARLDGQCK